jgi:hypothetical protein
MNPPDRQPDDPWEQDERALGRLFRAVMVRGGYGNVEQQAEQRGASTFATWGLGLFGAAIIVMLGFVLNAVYTTNGDLHEMKGQMKGQNDALQSEVVSLRTDVTTLSSEMAALNARRP